MVEELLSLASLLARDPLMVSEVIAHIGSVIHDYESNVLIEPSDSQFSEAHVVRNIDLETFEPIDTPSHVVLMLAEPIEVEDLTQAFGKYDRFEAEEKVPPQLIFYLDMTGQPYSVALIADVEVDRVIEITVRRDKRC